MFCKETSVQELPVPQHPSEKSHCCLAEGHGHQLPSLFPQRGTFQGPCATGHDAADTVNLCLGVSSRPALPTCSPAGGNPACRSRW